MAQRHNQSGPMLVRLVWNINRLLNLNMPFKLETEIYFGKYDQLSMWHTIVTWWRDTTRRDATRRDATRRDATRHDTTRHDTTWHDFLLMWHTTYPGTLGEWTQISRRAQVSVFLQSAVLTDDGQVQVCQNHQRRHSHVHRVRSPLPVRIICSILKLH